MFIGILGQAWSLIVSIPDLSHLSYFVALSRDIFERHTMHHSKFKVFRQSLIISFVT